MELIFGIAVVVLLGLGIYGIFLQTTQNVTNTHGIYQLLEKNNKTLEKILEELQSEQDYEYWLQENNETLEKILEKICQIQVL